MSARSGMRSHRARAPGKADSTRTTMLDTSAVHAAVSGGSPKSPSGVVTASDALDVPKVIEDDLVLLDGDRDGGARMLHTAREQNDRLDPSLRRVQLELARRD